MGLLQLRFSSSALLFALMFIIPHSFADERLDYFALVLMWPGAYCEQTNAGCCLPTTGEPAGDFLIKDLITYDSLGHPIRKCQNTNFNYNQLSNISDNLEAYWANIRCPSNNGRSSWRSKWKTYGVCSNLTEIDYFKTALALQRSADISFRLVIKGIHPDYNLYKLVDIKRAIAEGIGAEPFIRCSDGPFGKSQLFEVHICVGSDGKTFIECPVKPKFTCKDEILFYPFRTWMLNDTTKAFGDNSNIQMTVGME